MTHSFCQGSKIIIKFKADKAATLHSMDNRPMQLSKEGNVQTGIAAFDKLTTKYHGAKLKRVYRPAGKFEERHKKFGLNLWYELEMNKLEGPDLEKSINDFKKLAEVERVEGKYDKTLYEVNNKNITPNISFVPNDPMFVNQWHYNNTGQTGGTVGSDINLLNAWSIQKGSNNVTVAVIDQGIDITHNDLKGAMWVNQAEKNGIAGVDDDHNGYVDDIYGYCFGDNTGSIPAGEHGSHVGGTIGAVTNNGIGVSGIAGGSGSGDGVRLMSCAVFGSYGQDGFGEAFVYAADMGAVIAQNSWGYTVSGYYEQSVLDGIDYFIANAGMDASINQVGPMAGGLVIFAAGNSYSDGEYYPAYYDHVIAVAALDHNSQKTYYSNYGSWVDISAPGGNTSEAENQGVLSTTPGNTYSYFMGTSMACPHVSGVAALIVSQFKGPGLTPQFVWDRIVGGADNIDDVNPSYAGLLGSGRLNALNALLPSDTIPPAPIANLSAINHDQISVTLSWTATGSSGNVGEAKYYKIRYAKTVINEVNFESATLVLPAPKPKMAGEQETLKVIGLTPATTYYFAIEAVDMDGNASGISNVVSSITDPAPVVSIVPSALIESMDSGLTRIDTLVISNIGAGILNFSFPDFDVSSQQSKSVNNTAYLPFDKVTEKGKADTRVGYQVVTGRGSDGPDGFGYRWIDSKEIGGPTFEWEDITSNGTNLYLYDDDYQTIQLPFNFSYYGHTYQNVTVSANGFITFTGEVGSTSFNNEQIPSVNLPNALIAAFWCDLYSYYYYEGVSYNGDGNRLIIQYTNVYPYKGTGNYTFQIILYRDGDIKLQYLNMTGAVNHATTGIEDETGTNGLQIAFCTDYISNNLAVLITNKPAFITSVTPASGAINSGNNSKVLVEMVSKNLKPKNYTDTLDILTNDPLHPELKVPVALHINGVPSIVAEPDTLNFGQVFIIDTAKLQLKIINTGTDSLRLDSIVTGSNIFFTKDFKRVAIYSKDTIKINIYFAPVAASILSQDLIIYSNAVNVSAYSVHLTGHGVFPPVISVTKDSLSEDLFTGESSTQKMTIFNNGGSDLDLEISIEGIDDAEVAVKVNSNTIAKLRNFENIPGQSNNLVAKKNNKIQSEVVQKGFGNVTSDFDASGAGNNRFNNPNLSKHIIANAGNVIRTIPAPGHTLGLTWLKESLWAVVANSPQQLVEIDPNDGSVLSSFDLGSDLHLGLTSDGKNLWVCSWNTGIIQEYSTKGELLKSWSCPIGNSLRGIAWDGKALWIGGADAGMLYRLDTDGNILETRSLSLSIVGWVMDMEWVSKHHQGQLWIIDDGNDDINQLNVSSDPPVLIQDFASPNPSDYPEGIAHDGKNLWISGYYSSDIYLVDDGIEELEWLSVNPISDTINYGTSSDIEVTFNAKGLNGGDYNANIVIASNDPVHSKLEIPAHLHVTGKPVMEAAVDTVNFGQVFTGNTDTMNVVLRNTGTDVLVIDSMNVTNVHFGVDKNKFSVNCDDSTTIKVWYKANELHTDQGLLFLFPNDTFNTTKSIVLKGESVLTPVISVLSDSLYATLFVGDTTSKSLTIDNSTGGSYLNYSIEIAYKNIDALNSLEKSNNEQIIQNSIDKKVYTPGFVKKNIYSASSGLNILLLDDGIFNYYYDAAFGNLGLSRTLVSDWNTMYNEMTSGVKWDMIVVNSYGGMASSYILDSLNSFVKRGGLLIFAAWDVESYYNLEFIKSTLWVNYIATIFTPLNFYSTNPGHAIFNLPNDISELNWSDNQLNRDGQIAQAQGGSQAIASFDGYPGSESIIINSKNTTIFNAFQAVNYNRDDDQDGKMDIIELIENEISFLIKSNGWIRPSVSAGRIIKGSQDNINFKFDAKGLTAGDYFADVIINSNDPANPQADIPAHLHVNQNTPVIIKEIDHAG